MDDKPYIMLGHGRAYSSHGRVNVILSHSSNRDGNHFFPHAKGPVIYYIRKCVEQVIAEVRANGETLWPAHLEPRVTVRSDPWARGEYHWTAWDE